MDISLQLNPSKRAYAIQSQSGAKQAEKKSAVSQTDRVTVSRQALEYLEQLNRQTQAQKKSDQDQDSSTFSDGGASSILDTLSKSLKEMEKCSKIAASIMKGKRVPLEDLQYLMEHDIKGYQLAMAMRRPPEDDKEEKSVLDDEDRQGDTAESTSSVESAGSCESASESGEAPTGGEASNSAEAGSL
jgi:transglutaminase/protease-like cytokinesis protein 3